MVTASVFAVKLARFTATVVDIEASYPKTKDVSVLVEVLLPILTVSALLPISTDVTLSL